MIVNVPVAVFLPPVSTLYAMPTVRLVALKLDADAPVDVLKSRVSGLVTFHDSPPLLSPVLLPNSSSIADPSAVRVTDGGGDVLAVPGPRRAGVVGVPGRGFSEGGDTARVLAVAAGGERVAQVAWTNAGRDRHSFMSTPKQASAARYSVSATANTVTSADSNAVLHSALAPTGAATKALGGGSSPS